MRIIGAAASAILLLASRGAIAAPCAPTVITSQAPGATQTRLQILLAAGESFDKSPDPEVPDATWVQVRDEAIGSVAACDFPVAYPQSPALPYAFAFQSYAARTLDAVDAFMREHNETTPILVTAIGLPSVPAPQPVQVGLSQIVAAGQPGLMVSFAATPGIRSESHLGRHVVAAASGLVMNQPDETGTTNETKFASGEVTASYTSTRTVYDWAAEVDEAQIITDRVFDEHAWNAARLLVTELKTRLAAGAAPRDALVAAQGMAVRVYQDATRSYLQEHFAKPEIERPRDDYWGVGLRLRASPEPQFVPELPDKYAASVEAWGELHLAGSTSSVSATGHASAGYSARPTSGADGDTLLVDVAGGLSVLLRSATGPTRLSVLGLFRWAPREVAGDPELSAGATGLVQVPIGGDVALAGTLTWRARTGQSNETTTSITLAKAL